MINDQLIQNIEARTAEVAGYQTNIENYSRMIAKINGDWCPATAPLQGLDTQQMVAACADDEILAKASDLNFRDKLKQTLRAERIEQRKAILVLEVLKDQLGAN